MYRIGINALGLKSNSGGVETYIYNTVKALLDNDKDNLYYLFIGVNCKKIFEDLPEYKNFRLIVYPIVTDNSAIRVISENTLLPIDLLRYRIDLVHHMCNYMPKISPVKSVTTLHDMIAFFYNDNYPEYKLIQRFYNYFKKAMKYTAKNAKKIIAVSEFSKREFSRYYDIEESKLISIGQSLDIRKTYKQPDISILNRYKLEQPYLLSVSVVRRHKNYDFLIRVFNKLKEQYNIPHTLVIVGGTHFGANEFLSEIENSPYKNDIKYLGYIDDSNISSLYCYADAFIYPSLYEGFGIPLLEAMNYQIPVLASKEASLPEVGGYACLYFDARDENDATSVIYNFIQNKHNLKEDLVNKGMMRLKHYNRNIIAKTLLNCYQEVLTNKQKS